jgi:hypothetical protein
VARVLARLRSARSDRREDRETSGLEAREQEPSDTRAKDE